MSAGQARLRALYGGLSAKERALLVLRAVKEDGDADPAIRWTTPSRQQWQYHQLIGLISALNCELASAIFILNEQADKVSLRFSWLQSLQLWSRETTVLGKLLLQQGKALPPAVRRDVRKLVKRAPSFERVPFDLDVPISDTPEPGTAYHELPRAVAWGLRDTLLQHWRELGAIDVVVDEARGTFDGEDPLHPDVRQLLDATKATLLDVHAGFEPYVGGIMLPAPTEDEMAVVRKLIEKAIENGRDAQVLSRLQEGS